MNERTNERTNTVLRVSHPHTHTLTPLQVFLFVLSVAPKPFRLVSKDGMDKTSRKTSLLGKVNRWYLLKPQDERLYRIGRALMVDYEQCEGQKIRGVRIQHWDTTNKMEKPRKEANHVARDAPNSTQLQRLCPRCPTTYIPSIALSSFVSVSHVRATT